MPVTQSENSREGGSPTVARFGETHWSVIRSAMDKQCPADADTALEKLCRVYWPPLYAYVRRLGESPHDAQDLTQAFFARFLDKDFLASVDQAKGRFRSFMLAALKHFLSNERDKQRYIGPVKMSDQRTAPTAAGLQKNWIAIGEKCGEQAAITHGQRIPGNCGGGRHVTGENTSAARPTRPALCHSCVGVQTTARRREMFQSNVIGTIAV